MDTSALKEAGLTDGEIKVYLALLELGSSTTGPIVKKSGIAKSIVYQILEKLMQKGLVSHIVNQKTKYFQAADPDKLLQFIEEREKRLRENKTKIEEMLPELLLKQQLTTKNEANIFYGHKGIRTCHERTYKKLQKGDEYCYLGIPTRQPEEQHVYWQKDHLNRIKKGIKCRLLFNKDTDENIIGNRNKFDECEARRMSEDMKTPACFLTYKDTTVIILQYPTAIAVEIVNKEITESFQAYFEEFWRTSKIFEEGK